MNVIIVSLVGGMLCLDRVVAQLAVSRPIVAAPLIGWWLGDPYTGLVAGAFVELFWIDRLPMGIYIPPNETVVAILITGGAILSARSIGALPPGLLTLSILIYVPLGIVAQQLECRLCRKNDAVSREAQADADRGDARAIARKHHLAILRYYLMAAGLIVLFLPIGIAALSWAYPRLPGFMTRGLEILYGILPLIGCAAALQTITVRGAVPVFCGIFLSVTVMIAWLRGM